jgi:hypothetical protein
MRDNAFLGDMAMDKTNQRIQIRVDPYTRVCLTVIAVLLTVLIVGLWAEAVPSAPSAHGMGAGIPDAGHQRQQLIKEMQRNTAELADLVRLFESGTAKVQVADAGKGAGSKRATTKKAK